MKRKTANIDIRVEPQLVEKVDAWRAQQRVPPSRSAAIVYMLEHFLKHDLQPGRGSHLRSGKACTLQTEEPDDEKGDCGSLCRWELNLQQLHTLRERAVLQAQRSEKDMPNINF